MKQIRKTYKFSLSNEILIKDLRSKDLVLDTILSLRTFHDLLPSCEMFRFRACEYTVIVSKQFRDNIRLEYWK